MSTHNRSALAVLAAGIWINASEFFRNEWWLKSLWVEHYRSLGLVFPSEPRNGAMWMLWGFLYAGAVLGLSRRFRLVQTAMLAWLMGFVLMWVVTWNLGVLPLSILPYAVPLSWLEAFVAALICQRVMLSE